MESGAAPSGAATRWQRRRRVRTPYGLRDRCVAGGEGGDEGEGDGDEYDVGQSTRVPTLVELATHALAATLVAATPEEVATGSVGHAVEGAAALVADPAAWGSLLLGALLAALPAGGVSSAGWDAAADSALQYADTVVADGQASLSALGGAVERVAAAWVARREVAFPCAATSVTLSGGDVPDALLAGLAEGAPALAHLTATRVTLPAGSFLHLLHALAMYRPATLRSLALTAVTVDGVAGGPGPLLTAPAAGSAAPVLTRFTALRALRLRWCGLSSATLGVAVSMAASLAVLDVAGTEVSSLPPSLPPHAPNLRHLTLRSCVYLPLRDINALVAAAPTLVSLDVSETQADGSTLRLLTASPLARLAVSWCDDVTADDVAELARAAGASLRALECRCMAWSDAALTSVAGAAAGLEVFNLSRSGGATDAGIAAVVAGCGTTLLDLRVSWCTDITDAALAAILAGTPHLQVLDVGGCKALTESGIVAAFTAALPATRHAACCRHGTPATAATPTTDEPADDGEEEDEAVIGLCALRWLNLGSVNAVSASVVTQLRALLPHAIITDYYAEEHPPPFPIWPPFDGRA